MKLVRPAQTDPEFHTVWRVFFAIVRAVLDGPEDQRAVFFFAQHHQRRMRRNLTNLVHQPQGSFVVTLGVRRPQVQQYDVGRLADVGELIELLFTDRARRETIAQGPGNRFSQPRILRQEANSNYWLVQSSKTPDHRANRERLAPGTGTSPNS